MNLPIPTTKEPAVVARKPTKVKNISAKEATAAAKKAGFTTIRGDKLIAAGRLGEFVGQTGAIHLGRAMLAVAAERAAVGMDQCEKIIANGGLEPEVEAGLLKIHKDLLESHIKTAEALIKSAQVGAETEQIQQQIVPGFAPRTPVVPQPVTQVNIQLNGKQNPEPVIAHETSP